MDAINYKNKNKPLTEEQKQKKYDRRTKTKLKRLSKKNILQHDRRTKAKITRI